MSTPDQPEPTAESGAVTTAAEPVTTPGPAAGTALPAAPGPATALEQPVAPERATDTAPPDAPGETAEPESETDSGDETAPGTDPAEAGPDGAGPAGPAPTGEPDEPQEPVAGTLPDLTEDATLFAALESLLLVVDSPAEEEALADALEQPVKRIRAALAALAARYTEQGSGIDLRKVGGGWRLFTRDRFAPFVEKLLLDGQRAKLTRAALETLAVIAYRQPVTRARVAAVRGVNVDGVIRTLLARGLVEETGTDPETNGILYRTTELFLERLGLSSLEDLPPIAPLLPEVDAIDDV